MFTKPWHYKTWESAHGDDEGILIIKKLNENIFTIIMVFKKRYFGNPSWPKTGKV